MAPAASRPSSKKRWRRDGPGGAGGPRRGPRRGPKVGTGARTPWGVKRPLDSVGAKSRERIFQNTSQPTLAFGAANPAVADGGSSAAPAVRKPFSVKDSEKRAESEEGFRASGSEALKSSRATAGVRRRPLESENGSSAEPSAPAVAGRTEALFGDAPS